MNDSGKLYLVPTPVGNLGDMTFRAVEILNAVDLIASEDTRVTGKLLHHFEIGTPQLSFHSNNEHRVFEKLIAQLQSGKNIAVCSDAGTPGISDPGFLLVREAVKNNIDIECLPGATAIIPALVSSGVPCDKFYFEGFLPHKKGRQTRLNFLKTLPCTSVLYESPHRLLKTLTQIAECMGDQRWVVVTREISKKFESKVRGAVLDVISHFENHPPKGEFVIIIQADE